jgi:hypothetical protein
LCQDAATEIGLTRPSFIVGSTGLTEQRLLSLANRSVRDLMRWHDWQALIVSKTFTTLAQQVQTSSLPSNDYDRLVRNPKVWNRSLGTRYWGPTPQRYWQQLVNGGITGGVQGYWRILGGALNILPAPTAGETLSYEYISKRPVLAVDGTTYKETFTVDTDTCVLPESLIMYDMIWRFCKARGLARYAEDLSTFEREKERAAADDRGIGNVIPEDDTSTYPPAPFWNGTIG